MAKKPPMVDAQPTKNSQGGLPDVEAEAAAPPPASSKRKLIIIAAAVVLLILGAAVFLLGNNKDKPGQSAQVSAKPKAPPVFQSLEPITVNLPPGDQFLQVGATLKISDSKYIAELKLHMPELRHRLLLLLSGKTAAQLITAEGRHQLSEEIRAEANRVLGFKVAPPKPLVSAAPPAATSQAGAKLSLSAALGTSTTAASTTSPTNTTSGSSGTAAPPQAAQPPTDAADEPPAEPPKAELPPELPVLSCYFTSFIIQ